MGVPPSVGSDVYSLGMLILQLLTGSEAMGLLDYAQKAVDRGRLEDILDPCAEGISVTQADELAHLALRFVLRFTSSGFSPRCSPDDSVLSWQFSAGHFLM